MLEPIEFEKMVQIRAYRILNNLLRYKSCVDNDCTPTLDFDINPTDRLVGIYENSISNSQSNVFISNNGVYFYRGAWQFIEYSQMQRVRVPVANNEKRNANVLVVQTKSEETFELQFISGTSRFADVWEVSRFFMRIIEDWNKRF